MKTFILAALLLSCHALADDLEAEKKASAEYLALMGHEAGARVIDQGVVIRPVFESASTEYPLVSDTVRVAYHLVDREGKVLDESVTADELAEFPLNKLIQCWQIAVPKISVGSFYKVTCPSDTAYGDKGVKDVIKGGAALTFRLTVYGIKR